MCASIKIGSSLGAALAQRTAAALPAPLGAATIRAAARLAREGGAAGIVSASVAELIEGAKQAMLLSRFKIGMLLALTAGTLAVGVAGTARPKPANGSMTVRGRVLGPDGKPVQGARLYSIRVQDTNTRLDGVVPIAHPGAIGADGRFHVALNGPAYDEYVRLIAVADGFGVDWVDLSEDERPEDVTLRLPKDVPITGRLVNTEGRPVAGVSVSIAAIEVPANEKLDDYLKGWLRKFNRNLSAPRKRLYVPLDTITGTAKTDKDGHFALRGAGGERIVHVTFSGRGVARSTPFVITRPGFDPKPYYAVVPQYARFNRFLERSHFPGLYPPSFTFVADPGKAIEGVIKDADSGKPVAGCRLWARSGFSATVHAVSDAQGAYRLAGLRKNKRGYDVQVQPPQGSAYLGRRTHAADTTGLAKVPFNIELAQGATVSGRVVDRQTGKGVRCFVHAAALVDNPSFAARPSNHYLIFPPTGATDKDGRFRISVLPGPTLLMARVMEREKFHDERLLVFRRAVPDPDHKDLFVKRPPYGFWRIATAGNGVEFIDFQDAVKVMDIKKSGETNVELFVDRGVTARLAVQDADGKPLAGAWAAGLTDVSPKAYKLSEATATVFALDPAKPRTMAFFHAEKKLGGTATVRGDEKGPVVVKLAPLGRVTGRLLDGNGDPLEGAEMLILAQTRTGRGLYRYATPNRMYRITTPNGKLLLTGKDGRFHIDFIVPDLKFTLILRRGSTVFRGPQRIGFKQVKPGETLDLGDLRLNPAR